MKREWLLVAFMWLALLLNYSDRQVVFSIFPILKSELSFTDAQLGLTGSVFLWVYGLCSPIAGQVGDWFSKKKLVVTSLALWSAVTVLTGMSHSAFMLLACRGMIGVTESLFFPAAIALIAGAHGPKTRSRAIGAFDTAQLAGVVLGGWLGGYVAQRFHWRLAFYFLGTVGIVYALPYFAFLKTVPEETPAEPRKSSTGLAVVELARVHSYVLLCLASSSLVLVLWLLYTWLPSFLYEKFSLSLADAGFTATVYLQSGTVIGLLSGGFAADWLYKRVRAARFWLVASGLLFSAPALHLVGNSGSLALTKLAAHGLGLCAGLFIANLAAAAFDVVPAHTRASAMGFINLIGTSISGFGALFGGLWKNSVGLEAMMTYAAWACVAAGALVIVTTKFYFPKDYHRAHPV